jgi:ABC-type branched-subunit amino acid transport system permease subunit
MMILGGTRSLGGSLLGAVIIGLLPQLLDSFPTQLGNLRVQDLGPAIYALLLLLTLRFFPEGLWNAIVTRRVLTAEARRSVANLRSSALRRR